MNAFIDLGNPPAKVMVQTDSGWLNMPHSGDGLWERAGVAVERRLDDWHISASVRLKRVLLRWENTSNPGDAVALLGDAWERGYGDLQWSGIVAERIMPWYFAVTDGHRTHGYGVKTQPNAFCSWYYTGDDITLCLDLRCLQEGVGLRNRRLHMATLATREGAPGETPFEALCSFCRDMCGNPKTVDHPIYGGNNWYYAYGNSSAGEIIADTENIAKWSRGLQNRPYMVIDACWQERMVGGIASGGPYRKGNEKFADMKGLADEIRARDVRPGLWCRPLLTSDDVPKSWIFRETKEGGILDPTLPEVLALIGEDVARFVGWGYDMIKHDFTTYDILGKWGPQMNDDLVGHDGRFANDDRTTAEVIKSLYEVIAKSSGNAVIIGCNTVSHLSAGAVHLQRTGNDTSGLRWEKTRKMGVNTLAFRMPQHGAFYLVDADCVGVTERIPWELNKQWLSLLAESGTPLFVSADPKCLTEEMETDIKAAFEIAARPREVSEPVDWLTNACPKVWKTEDGVRVYQWHDADDPRFS